jgi:hypothetical protein
MSTAIVGVTGLVGGTLARAVPDAAGFHSRNVDSIAGRSFDLLLVAGMPAAKWIANADPEADRAVLDRLTSCVERCHAGQVVVFSTVDVYASPVGVDEETPIDPAEVSPYGRHRWELEQRLAARFPRTLVVRLPALFGRGLKKNAIYDLLNDHETSKIPSAAEFQFYSLTWLWDDVRTALAAGLALVNFAVEPMSVAEAARDGLGREFSNDPGSRPPCYDMWTRHAAAFGATGRYLRTRGPIIDELREFAAAWRRGER